MDLWPIELRDPVFLIPKLLMYDVCLSFKRLTIRHLFAKMEPGAEFQNASQVCTIKYEGRRDILPRRLGFFQIGWEFRGNEKDRKSSAIYMLSRFLTDCQEESRNHF